jgi:predicted metal-binding membrane protein
LRSAHEQDLAMSSAPASQRAFDAISALLFATSATLTVAWCDSMSAMHDMAMPGGPSRPSMASGALGLLPGDWTMSMMWMRMPGQTWPGAAAAFLGMWVVMMVAMMLPSLVPMLSRYRRSIGCIAGTQLGALTALVGTGYFFVWTLFGALAFLAGTTLAELVMQSPPLSRAVPAAIGAIVLVAGALQFSAWKAHHLACCRGMPACCDALAADARTAWRYGLRLGVHCAHCCFGLTVILLAVGMMNLRAMMLVTAAISIERLAPGGMRAAHCIGAVLVATGLFLLGQAALA